MGEHGTLFAPSRRAIAIVVAAFLSLLVLNAALHGPAVRDIFAGATPNRISAAPTPSVVATTQAPTSTKATATGDETISIVMVMVVAGSAREGQHMLKSALMRTSRALDVHVLCSDDAVPLLQQRLALVTRPAHAVRVTFYPLAPAAIVARATRAGVASKHHAGAGGLVKMFLHELLPVDVEHALYVDTDAFFAADPALLWDSLRNMTETSPHTLLAFPHAGPQSHGGLICSCVMAMNLAAMRAAPLMPSTLVPSWASTAIGSNETWAAGKMDPANPMWGDQGLLYAMWRRFPDRFWPLSRSWDISACRVFYRLGLSGEHDTSLADEARVQLLGPDTADAHDGVLFPGIIHFNCQEGEESAFERPELLQGRQWGPLLTTVAHYKWVWLNQGSERLVTHVVPASEVRFEDERRAAAASVER